MQQFQSRLPACFVVYVRVYVCQKSILSTLYVCRGVLLYSAPWCVRIVRVDEREIAALLSASDVHFIYKVADPEGALPPLNKLIMFFFKFCLRERRQATTTSVMTTEPLLIVRIYRSISAVAISIAGLSLVDKSATIWSSSRRQHYILHCVHKKRPPPFYISNNSVKN